MKHSDDLSIIANHPSNTLHNGWTTKLRGLFHTRSMWMLGKTLYGCLVQLIASARAQTDWVLNRETSCWTLPTLHLRKDSYCLGDVHLPSSRFCLYLIFAVLWDSLSEVIAKYVIFWICDIAQVLSRCGIQVSVGIFLLCIENLHEV